jgi:hypothetical protein
MELSMNFQVKLAETEEEVDAVFRGRYRVFVDTDAYIAPNDENRLYDRYDTYPTTANFIALHEQEVVGGLRFTERSAVGSSSEEAFKFGYSAPSPNEVYGAGSWLFLDRAYRKTTRITYCLWALAYAWAQERRWSKLLCVANPAIVSGLLNHGFRQLGDIHLDPKKNLPFVPIMRDLRELEQSMQALIDSLLHKRRARHDDVQLLLPQAHRLGRHARTSDTLREREIG